MYPEGYYGYGESQYGYGYGGGFSPGGSFGYGVNPVTTPAPTPPATNAEWAQRAIKDLRGDGFQSRRVAEALGDYELGREVTPAQQIFRWPCAIPPEP